jgi:hypothetical protein
MSTEEAKDAIYAKTKSMISQVNAVHDISLEIREYEDGAVGCTYSYNPL